MDNNYVVGANQAGDVTVYFRPDGQGGDGWHYGYLYIAAAQTYLTVKIESLGEAFVFDGVEHTKKEYRVTYGAEGDADYVSEVVTVIEDNGVAYFTLPTGDQIVITPDPEAKIMHVEDNIDMPVANKFTYTIENADRYEPVTTVFGKLTMTARPVTINIVGNTATVTYNGEEQRVVGFEWTTEDVVFMAATTESGFSVVGYPAQTSGERDIVAKGTEVGTYPMNISDSSFGVIQALPQLGTSYSDYTHWLHDFEVEFVIVSDGSLTITKRPITIKVTGNTLTVPYDGEEHQVDGFTYTCDDEVFMAEINAAQSVTLQSPDKPRAVGTEVGTYYMGLDASGEWVFMVVGTIEGGIPDFKIENFDYTIEIVSDGWLEITAPLEEPAFKTQSLVLDGQIGVHFFVFLPANSGYEYQGVNFTIDNTDGPDAFVPYSADMPTNANGYYRFTYYVRSIEMADTITATLQYTVNGEERTLEKTYSVKQYFETFDDYMSLFTEKQQVMTKATADYGHYVQAFLETQRTWTIGTDYAEMDKFYTVYTADDISAAQSALQAYAAEKSLGSNMQKITYTLVLDSDTELRIYFKPAADYTGTYTFTMDGEAITEDGEKVSVKLQPDGRYLVSIKNIAAHELSVSHRIAAVGDGIESYIELSALSYVNAMMTAYASNAMAVNAAVAILRYAEAAYSLKYGD
jgi:hypothetical protein